MNLPKQHTVVPGSHQENSLHLSRLKGQKCLREAPVSTILSTGKDLSLFPASLMGHLHLLFPVCFSTSHTRSGP